MHGKSDQKTPKPADNACPYIGLKDDRTSFAAYPSEWNVCYRVKPIESPKMVYQSNLCLDGAFENCPIYHAPEQQKMPRSIQRQDQKIATQTKKIIGLALLGVISIAFFVLLLFQNQWGRKVVGFLSPDHNSPPAIIDVSANGTEDLDAGQVNLQPTNTSTITLTNTPSPTMTITPSPTVEDPVLMLEQPIGGEYQFVIHRVIEGETLQYYADQYRTNPQAIINANYNPITPLWVDWLVVIPVDISVMGELPSSEVYQVEQEGTLLATIAEQEEVQLADLCLYNHIDAGHVMHEGEWLLIPRPRNG